MSRDTILVELILAGFFAVACLRAIVPEVSGGPLHIGNLLRFPGRIERLRRSRWQWFSMVALLLVIRLQKGVPLVIEATVVMQFLLFLAMPASMQAVARVRAK